MTDQSVNNIDMKVKKTQEPRKAKIMDAALELFAKKGYAQTSVDSIAKKANVSKGLIYHYFSGKQELLKSIFASLLQEAEIMFEGKEKLSSEQFLNRMVDYSINFIIEGIKMYRLILAISVQPEVAKGLKAELEKTRSVWIAKITEAFKEQGYKQPELEAYYFSAIFDGIGFAYIMFEKDYPINELKTLMKQKYNLSHL